MDFTFLARFRFTGYQHVLAMRAFALQEIGQHEYVIMDYNMIGYYQSIMFIWTLWSLIYHRAGEAEARRALAINSANAWAGALEECCVSMMRKHFLCLSHMDCASALALSCALARQARANEVEHFLRWNYVRTMQAFTMQNYIANSDM